MKRIIPTALAMLCLIGTACQFNQQEKMKMNGISQDTRTFKINPDIKASDVRFKNRFGITLAGHLYLPKDFDATKQYPAIAVSGPFGAVKEQVSGRYAQKMAEYGFVTVAFDPSFTGESSGEPRDINSPDINTEDFSAAVDFLSVLDYVNPDRIGIIGICGWGGFALNAAAIDTRIKATATITMYDMSRVTANGYNDSADTLEARRAMRRTMNDQRIKDFKSGQPAYQAVLPDPEELTADSPQFVRDYVSFYKTPRGYHRRSPGSTHGWAITAALPLLNTKLLAYADEIESPVLLVHGENAHSRYFSEGAFQKLKGDNKELLIVPGANHCDLYDGMDVIPFDKIAAFFTKNLK